ncbi:carbohydrate-binding protein [Sphingomonas cavernae]|uniref:beta-N-acetylhexosaminidase n=2 Tax=Sphingomonas cavernae TaxID=2320861 RepID=A0A418W8A7_9SPHN|nr:carbohydrate-binding protein [Sphingomonas cavernae]
MNQRFTLLAAGILLATSASAAVAASAAAPPLLPLPQSIAPSKGSFRLTGQSVIVVPPGDAGARAAAERLAGLLAVNRGISPAITETQRNGAIRFVRTDGITKEGYRLDVTPRGATITASDDAGLFYGAVTLWQLATSGSDAIPATRIADAPRFRWRGLMLDSARHFQSPEFIKRFIDWMAVHKLNTFHWHLVDDQGWRIEIKKYPKLVEAGAWRTPASAPGAPTLPRTGGYYTQEQIREIVAYAAARHITIVPEIEMPGHALAPIRAYAGLGTGVIPPPGIESDWGVFPYLFNIEDGTFTFLQDVLTEVMALFPSEYIHVGGDEAVKDQWKASPRIQAQMKALGIRDEHALQSWFIQRMEKFLSSKGRRLIGWDEILEGGLAPNATVMSWTGVEGAVAAAKAGHDAVLSPQPVLYLNHRQGGTSAEPPGRGEQVTLRRVYDFDPAPDTLTDDQQRHILGLQANLWTEHMRTEERVAYSAFPRASAVAELGWSAADKRDFDGFVDRLVPQLARLKPMGLEASSSAFAPFATLGPAGGDKATITLANQIGAEIRYTTDGSAPDANSPVYARPLSLVMPTRVRAASFRHGMALPGNLDQTVDAMTIRRRDDTQLKLCTETIALQLEDDAPAEGKRAAFLTDIMNPCWVYEAAPLDGVNEIAVDVGQIPFNFQIGKDIEKIVFRPPATPEGEIEVRIDSCEGERIAVLPLAPAASNPALTTLKAKIAPRSGSHDLCFTYTAKGPSPMWAIDAVQLIPRP